MALIVCRFSAGVVFDWLIEQPPRRIQELYDTALAVAKEEQREAERAAKGR